MTYDTAKLRTMKPTERRALWENAKRIGSPEALSVLELIETSGLDYRQDAGVTLDSPIGKAMQRIVFSAEGKKAVADALAVGLPPLATIDPLLKAVLGSDYGRHNESTMQAGYLVANLARQLGYEIAGSASLPEECVARVGATFARLRRPRRS